MKKFQLCVARLLILALLCSLLPIGVRAASTNVSGTVYVSSLADKVNVKLAGDTTLIVDAEKTLETITGDHSLTIRGDRTLTLAHSGKVINVADLVLSAPIRALGYNDYAICAKTGSVVVNKDLFINAVSGVYAKKDIVINAGQTALDLGILGLRADESITIRGNVVAHARDGDLINAEGDILIETSEYGGYVIAMTGYGSLDSGPCAICSRSGDIIVKSGQVNAAGFRGIYAKKGSVSLSGRIEINGGNRPAIHAEESVIVQSGTVKVDGYANGIWAGRDVRLLDSTVDVKGGITAIGTDSGSVIIDGDVTAASKDNDTVKSNGSVIIRSGTVTVTNSGGNDAVYSAQGLIRVEDGTVTVKGGTGLCTKLGDVALAGVVRATGTSSAAITAQSGSVTLQGTITADGKQTGISAKQNINIKRGSLLAQGGKRALLSDAKSINLSSPLRIIVPENGKISGQTVTDANDKTATFVQIMVPPLTGGIRLSSITPAPGAQLSYSLSGTVAELDESTLRYQWQQSSNGETGWTDMQGMTNKYHVVQLADVGKYLRVRITADGYDGMICSAPRLCVKWPCSTGVVSPILEVSGNQVRVMNPRSNQEYIIFSYKKDAGNLTPGDWANSKTWNGSDTVFYLGGTANTVNYVYTRVRETDGTYAGTAVGWQSLYLGTTTAVQDIAIQPQLMVSSDGTWISRIMDTDEHNYYYAKLGDVIQITATPTPANATFNGIQGSQWLVRGSAVASQYGRYYTTPECTTVISRDQYYRTVYFRPENTMINGMELRASYTRGYNDVASDAFSINVGNKLGVYSLQYVQFPSVSIEAGDSLQDIAAETHPDRATLEGCTAALTSGTGTAPAVTFDEAAFSVDAGNADAGDYYYKVLRNGSEIGGITVHVTAPPVEELRIVPAELTAEPGFSGALALQFFPANSETQAVWKTSDPAVATVTDGVVTITDAAPVAGTATITAAAGGKTAACLVTVAGEVFDLTVDGTKVTTRNMDDVLGNGVFSFDGFRTLTVSGSYTGSKDVISNNGMDGLVIRVEADSVLTCTRESNSPILLRADTTITGPGKLTLSGGDTGVYLTKTDGTLTVRDASLNVSGNWGIGGTNGKNEAVLVIDHAEITVDSGYGAICDFGGGITLTDCEIAMPEGGKISDDGKDIVDESGTRSTKVQIKAVRASPFEDVAEDTYYYEPIRWAVNHDPQITNGTSPTTFSPNATCTRAQVVTFLWRAMGQPEPTKKDNPFTDVKEGQYYYKAVLWALEKGITTGTSATTFSPDSGCTRGQVVTFLHRAQGTPTPGSSVNPFTDVPAGQYYYDAVLWAVNHSPQITNGTSATTFSPNATCTRGQIVTFLYRSMK